MQIPALERQCVEDGGNTRGLVPTEGIACRTEVRLEQQEVKPCCRAYRWRGSTLAQTDVHEGAML